MPLLVKAELFSPGSKSRIRHRPTDWLIFPASWLVTASERGRVHFANCWAGMRRAYGVSPFVTKPICCLWGLRPQPYARNRFGGFTQSVHESTEIAVFLMH